MSFTCLNLYRIIITAIKGIICSWITSRYVCNNQQNENPNQLHFEHFNFNCQKRFREKNRPFVAGWLHHIQITFIKCFSIHFQILSKCTQWKEEKKIVLTKNNCTSKLNLFQLVKAIHFVICIRLITKSETMVRCNFHCEYNQLVKI